MSLEKFVPRPEQEAAIQAILADHFHLSRAETGAGKTLVGVEAILRSGVKRSLTVAPLNTYTGWRKTFERQSGGAAALKRIDSTKAGKQAWADYVAGTGCFFIGWERFRMLSWAKDSPDFIVYDEIHRGAGRKTSTHTAMTSVRAEYVLGLSATPFANRIEGAWAVLRSVFGTEGPAGKHFWPWVTKYLHTIKDPYSPGPKPAGEKEPGMVWASIPSKSFFPSPFQEEPIVHEVFVELKPAQRKVYDQLEREAFVWLEEHPLAPSVPATKYLRLREVCLAIPSIRFEWKRVPNDPDYEPKGRTRIEDGRLEEEVEVVYFEEDAKSTKIDAALEVLSDLYADGHIPVVIYTHSKKFATMMTKRLQKHGYEARQFIGGMSTAEREWKLTQFGHEFDILVVTIPAVSEGVDGLQLVCHTEFWMSVDESRILNHQAKGRLSRAGQTKTVNRYLFFAENTVETNRQLPRQETDQAMLDASFAERTAA